MSEVEFFRCSSKWLMIPCTTHWFANWHLHLQTVMQSCMFYS
jgi:hypothetical protein